MSAAETLRRVRTEAGLSVRALAEAAGVAASTVHRIEQGELHPTVEMLGQIMAAAGRRLRLEVDVDYAVSVVGLAQSIAIDVPAADQLGPVRKAAELASTFAAADPATRHRMIAAKPPPTGDPHWDAFVAGLAEWLAVRAGMPAPSWVRENDRYLHEGWWVSPMPSMRAWEYAGSPASLQIRGVYLHRDSLVNA